MIKKGITSYHLKLIALISMLIDHIGVAFFAKLINASYVQTGRDGIVGAMLAFIAQNQEAMWIAYEAMRWIGRLAFPMYCFLLVQGFVHTKSVPKYALRLAVFAIISEIPFDMAFNGCVLELSSNNVFITLLLGIAMLWCISYSEKLCAKVFENEFLSKCAYAASVVFVFVAAYVTVAVLPHADYGIGGIITILIMYLMRNRMVLSYAVAVAVLALISSPLEALALLMLIPIFFYNGERGRPLKYVFYVFYPAHLVALAGFSMLMGIY